MVCLAAIAPATTAGYACASARALAERVAGGGLPTRAILLVSPRCSCLAVGNCCCLFPGLLCHPAFSIGLSGGSDVCPPPPSSSLAPPSVDLGCAWQQVT